MTKSDIDRTVAPKRAGPGMRVLKAITAPSARYLGVRLLQGLAVLFGAVVISFLLIHITGNPAEVLVGGRFTGEQVQQLSERLGYNRPLLTQFLDYMGGVLQGDFGDSFRFQEPAIRSVLRALPDTLILVAGAIGLASVITLPLAIISVLKRETFIDRLLRRGMIIGQGIPEFWLGLLLVLFFAVQLGVLPSIGNSGFNSAILPVVTLAVPLVSILGRLLRADLLDIMTSDFVTALRAKGLTEFEILTRHGIRNAFGPFITFLALQLGWLVGGTIVVEAVFVWPGIGTLALGAVETRDLPVLQSIVVVVAFGYVALNLAVDLIMLGIDPRIRLGRTK